MVEALYRNKLHYVVEVGDGDCVYLERALGAALTKVQIRRVPLDEPTLVIEPTPADVEQAGITERAARRVLASLPAHVQTYEGPGCPLCQNYIRYQETNACILCGR